MARTYEVELTGNESVEVVIENNYLGVYVKTVQWSETPESGSLLFEFMDARGVWHPMRGGVINLASSAIQPSPRIVGEAVRKVRVTTVGVPTDVELTVLFFVDFQASDGVDPRIYGGLQALTTQPFVEANVKNGTQFNASSYFASVPSGFNLDLIIITGSKPILIKAQDIGFNGDGIQATFYRGPTYTGGVDVSSLIHNANDINPQPTTVQFIGGSVISPSNFPAVTDVGIQISPTITILGADPQGNSTLPTGRIRGLDQALRPNATYLFRRTTLPGGNQAVTNFATWYEGVLSNEI